MTNLKIFMLEFWYPHGRRDIDLAKAVGVDPAIMSRWISGAVEPPLQRKIQIAKALGVDSRQLWPEQTK